MALRADTAGIFWDDTPPPKPPAKEKIKCVPPERTWERPDYLPGLDEALAFPVPRLTEDELFQCSVYRRELIHDAEVYPNYFCVCFLEYLSGKVYFLEMVRGQALDTKKLEWMRQNIPLTGFNSIGYDSVMLALAIAGYGTDELYNATLAIIRDGLTPRDVLKRYSIRTPKTDHVDVIEVAPLQASLKTYGGRLHTPRMQDLPFPPGTELTPQQMAIVRWYCVNDLVQTCMLRECLSEALALRQRLGLKYGLELRSKSDAQIAEAIITKELEQLTGKRPLVPTIPPGTRYRYKAPDYLRFQTPKLQWVLQRIVGSDLVVGLDGKISTPADWNDLEFQIGEATYRMGRGGLHSTETKVSYKADADYALIDRDVTSYYPAVILGQGLYPQHLGTPFLHVFKQIVDQRLAAKKSGDKKTADSLKITINGTFGKTANPYSVMYSPDIAMQITLTGQLTLLLLIERLELAGIRVISGNTDGAVILCPRKRLQELNDMVHLWEQETGFETEETQYSAVYSANVNNYIAVKLPDKKGKVKTKNKGWFNNPWNDDENPVAKLFKNPTTTVCTDAIEQLLIHGTPVDKTIRECVDPSKFVEVRTVRGGAVKDGEYLGKSIRWYYAQGETGHIIRADTGAKVPRTDGARPLMRLGRTLPPDVDYDWYIARANSLLEDMGYVST